MKTGFSLGCAALVSAVALSASQFVYASSEAVLYSFPSSSGVLGQVQLDSSGNLYGTTVHGFQDGTVYRLQQSQGVWQAENIHVFDGTDGEYPTAGLASILTPDALYGNTQYGGSQNRGVIFKLSQTGGQYTESTLHEFAGSDGAHPYALLTRDKATGKLYGTTYSGGDAGCGTVFQINPANGKFNTVYTFQDGRDGCRPIMQLKEGIKPGTLIGAIGSPYGDVLFLLTRTGGTWTKSVLHTFMGGDDGRHPFDLTALSTDGTNTMYGIAEDGGYYNGGVAFQLARQGHEWVYSVIYNFPLARLQGLIPIGIYLDNLTGALYGTTVKGGAYNYGTVFKLTQSDGKWTRAVLYSFGGAPDGAYPESRPIIDHRTGILYGTTETGGANNSGTVYSVTLNQPA